MDYAVVDACLGQFRSMRANAPDRFEVFYMFTRGLYNNPASIPQRHRDALVDLAQNEDDALIRFHALSSLAYIASKCENYESAAQRYAVAKTVYDNMSAAERRRRVKGVHLKANGEFDLMAQIASGDALDATVGELMDREMKQVKEWSAYVEKELATEKRVEELGWKEAFIQDMSKLGFSKDVVNGFMAATESGALDSPIPTAPHVSSGIIERVKQLPEQDDECFFVMHDTKMPAATPYYRIFSVDMARYESGEQSKLFDQVGLVKCDPKETKVKRIVGTFAVACLQHMGVTKESREGFVPHRPKKLLIEPGNNNTQIASFLSMMGCNSVETIDPDLRQLLDQKQESVCRKSVANQLDPESHPHLRDHTLKIWCGNCKKTGPQLKVCPCKKAYFCNQECIKAVWAQHKPFHKQEMARRKQKAGES